MNNTNPRGFRNYPRGFFTINVDILQKLKYKSMPFLNYVPIFCEVERTIPNLMRIFFKLQELLPSSNTQILVNLAAIYVIFQSSTWIS